ncbi:MAG: alanine dehydrogenase [Clostridiaceae bacterium]|nr:alanine dehydrogenase [Clostridiaceae bacterium]
MIIGVPKEIKDLETRVGLTPRYVKLLTEQGYKVLIQKGLAAAADVADEEYIKAGADIVETANDVYNGSEMVIKFKDYIEGEYDAPMKEGQIIFCFFHLGENEPDFTITNKMIMSKATGISYELLQQDDGSRPVMKPMSEIAGRLTAIVAAQLCQKPFGGSGVCPAAITGVKKPKYIILGGGNAGFAAAQVVEALGAEVTVFEMLYDRLQYLRPLLSKSQLVIFDKNILEEMVQDCDVLINTIYPYPGMEIPVVSRDMVKTMKKGSVIIDIVGTGIIETSRYTTISDPTYIEEGVVHYGVDNMPALVPATSSEAFCQTIYPFVSAVANKGLKKACEEDKVLCRGMSFYDGHIVHKDIAQTHDMPYKPFDTNIIK